LRSIVSGEVYAALEAMDHCDGPGRECAIECVHAPDQRHDRVIPLAEVALDLRDLREDLFEVFVFGRRAVAKIEVHLVERVMQNREHEPRVAPAQAFDADALRGPHVRVVEQATRDAQHRRAGLVAPHALEDVLDPMARVMHHHMHRVMAVQVGEHGRGV